MDDPLASSISWPYGGTTPFSFHATASSPYRRLGYDTHNPTSLWNSKHVGRYNPSARWALNNSIGPHVGIWYACPYANNIEFNGVTIEWPNYSNDVGHEFYNQRAHEPHVDLIVCHTWSIKSKARVFSRSNHDVGVRPFVQGPLMECVCQPRVLDILRFECSDSSDGTSPVYSVGSSFCANTVNSDVQYILKPVQKIPCGIMIWVLRIMCVRRPLI